MSGGLFAIESIEVGEGEMEALVRVADERLMRTSANPGLTDAALSLLPGLARHTCENGAGFDAVREFADTETPHLLEHVAVELMALSGSPRDLRGRTSWDFARDGRGVFRLRLAYDIDVVALAALKEAAAIVEWLMHASGERPDVRKAVARLRAVRESVADQRQAAIPRGRS